MRRYFSFFLVFSLAVVDESWAQEPPQLSEYVLESYGAGSTAVMPDSIAFDIFVETVVPSAGEVGRFDTDSDVYWMAQSLGMAPEYGGVERLSLDERARIYELRRELKDAADRIGTAAENARRLAYCNVPDTDVSSEQLLDRMLIVDTAPIDTAAEELTLYRSLLSPAELESFDNYLQRKIKRSASYTRIDNRYFYDDQMDGMSEGERLSYIRQRYSAECAAAGGS